jgi:hypothetical protein
LARLGVSPVNARNVRAGIIVALVGLAIGLLYPYILLASPPDKAVHLLVISFSAIALLVGAFLGAVAWVLIRGIRVDLGDEDSC